MAAIKLNSIEKKILKILDVNGRVFHKRILDFYGESGSGLGIIDEATPKTNETVKKLLLAQMMCLDTKYPIRYIKVKGDNK